jgi:hypothetical protein
VSEEFLRSIWSSWLSSNLQAILAGQPKGDFNAAASCADLIFEAAAEPAKATVATLPDSKERLLRIEDLSHQVVTLSVE